MAYSQPGFNYAYDFNGMSPSFSNLLLKHDTLTIYGTLQDVTPPHTQGVFLAKCDTNGNIINYNMYFDSTGDDYVFVANAGIVENNDELGYCMVGSLFNQASGYLMKVSSEGDLSFIKTYHDNTSIQDFYSSIIETENGYLIAGHKQRQDYQLDVFLMKVDKYGNKSWEKFFDEPNRQYSLGSFYKKDPNTYIMGIVTSSPQSTPLSSIKLQSKIIAVDSLGNLKWAWQTPLGLDEGGVQGLQLTNEGNWIYTTGRALIYPSLNMFTWQPKIVMRDSNLNLIWFKEVGLSTSSYNGFTCLQYSPEGNYVALGQMVPAAPTNVLSGWTYKISSTGDSIWNRLDTVFWNPNSVVEHYLSGAVILQSGSIIACGYTKSYMPDIQIKAWLIKINKDGCIDTLNCVTLTSDNASLLNIDVNVFPNPTSSVLNIETLGVNWDRVEVVNSTGTIILTANNDYTKVLDIRICPPGLYFLRFIELNKVVSFKKIFKT